jgi:hypothetical protein
MFIDLQYKCRLCGEVYTECSYNTSKAITDVESIIKGRDGVHLSLIDIHTCEDGSVGVTDFIGLKNKEPKKLEKE